MDITKHLKPNLVDPNIEESIIKKLKPPVEDYWAPTKSGLHKFYHNFIRPNIYLIIFIIIVLLLLYYRYRRVKADKEKEKLEDTDREFDKSINNDTNSKKNYHRQKNSKTSNSSKKQSIDDTELLLQLYNLNKENLREPPITKSNFAYPMYPYHKGGTLISPGSR